MENTDVVRSRAYAWSDPRLGAEIAATMSGYDYLKSIADGTIAVPPIMNLMGIEKFSVEPGFIKIEFLPKEYHYNTIGGVHGGVFSTLLDSALSCAVHSTLAQGVGYATIDLKVSFIRGISIETGLVFCEGRVVHSGKKTALAEGKIVDSSGKLFATASATCIIL